MKKILLLVGIIILGFVIVIFFPKKISLGGGMLPQVYFNTCKGVYIQTHDDSAVDGDRGGLCFGKIVTIVKPLDPPHKNSGSCTSTKGKIMTYQQALEIAKQSSCAEVGIFTNEFNCNSNAGGLIDVYMDPVGFPGCGFSCRISIDGGNAEQGWMCTGGKL